MIFMRVICSTLSEYVTLETHGCSDLECSDLESEQNSPRPSTDFDQVGVQIFLKNYIWYCTTSGTAVLSLSTAAIIAIGTVLGDQYIIRKSATCWFAQATKRQKWYYSRENRFGPRLARHRASLSPNLFSLKLYHF